MINIILNKLNSPPKRQKANVSKQNRNAAEQNRQNAQEE